MRHLLAALTLALFTQLGLAETQPASQPLFAATLADLDDKPVALSRFQGKPLVVNFWARWCAPCRAEIPELVKFRNAYKDRIEVLGIGIEDQAQLAKEFAKTQRMDYPAFVARDQGIPLMKALGNSKGGLPYTVFIDRHGKVVATKMGLIKSSDLEAAAERLLQP